MSELYLMRHGETLFNQTHRIQGACDSPLTKQGIADAKEVGRYLKQAGITFDHAYSSTQERASDTLECVTDQPYQRLKGIKEWNFGLYEGESERLNPPIDPQTHTYKDYFVYYGGESDVQVQQRMTQTLTQVMNQPDHQRVLAVSHGGACFAFLMAHWPKNRPFEQAPHLKNCNILRFTYDKQQFTFEEVINVKALINK